MKTEIGQDIEKAAFHLLNGNLVAIPTETVYGLAANALQEQAVLKIFEAKKRPFFNPLIIHIAKINDLNKYARINDISYKLAKEFMPGALTLLLPKKPIIPDIVTAGSTKVAIRIPKHPLTQELLQKIDFPLAAPSANIFGYVSPVNATHVSEGLNGVIPYILDGGNCTIGLESTIVEVIENDIFIHRIGGVSIEEIESSIHKKVLLKKAINLPETSGQLKSHYATSTPLYQGNISELVSIHKEKKIAIISFNHFYDEYNGIPQFVLSKNKLLTEAAHNLFSTFRKLDKENYDVILVENFPNLGIGKAINDRIKRAQFTMKNL